VTHSDSTALAAWRNDAAVSHPLISAVVPYKDYDVLPLAHELLEQASAMSTSVQIVFADDGSDDASIGARLRELFSSAQVPCVLLTAARNIGRAAIRNRLAQAAEGEFLLYLDADMLPDSTEFLQRYRQAIADGRLDIVCGGRSYQRVVDCPDDQALYRFFSLKTECVGPEVRNTRPLWYLLTNNLCVRRTLVLQHPFHESYAGWGFEDAEWALRLGAAQARHIDNTASHMGLLNERELLGKYDSSRENFRLISAGSPEFRRFSLFRASRALAWLPLPSALMRGVARWLVLTRALPMRLRYLGIHGYRASLYAGVLRQGTAQ
jgi:glycosyltransferase involved in cell wall biosynthesis